MKSKTVELKPNIFQIRGQKPGSHIYIIKGSIKNVMIDAGITGDFLHLKMALQEIGLIPEQINMIILTHEHFDHMGSCIYFYNFAIIAAHRLAANKICLQDEFVIMNKLFNLSPTNPFHADIWLENDTIIDTGNYKLHVIHTPGHCSGCICLYEPDQKILFTGDTIFSGGTLSGIFSSGSISDYVHSLEKLSQLNIEYMYPGHGGVSDNPVGDLNRALSDSRCLLDESKILFEALDTKKTFQQMFKSIRKFPLPQN